MKLSREIKTAILVLSGIALFIYMFTYLKGEDLFSNTETYYTVFDYNALSRSSPIKINGNTIGKIEDIKYIFETGKTKVIFSVDSKFKFSKNSLIRLYETGLMSGNGLAIIDANDGIYANPGDFITSEVEPGLIESLKHNFSGLGTDLSKTLRSADTLMMSLDDLVTDKSEKGIQNAISELNLTLKSFKSLASSVENLVEVNDKKIASLLTNFNSVSENLDELSTELKNAGLSDTLKNLNTTLNGFQNILASIDKGDGTIGKLLKDEKLYKNLEGASKQMELLLLDIKLHPARYRRILSKKEIPYEKPTEDQMN